MHHRTIVMLLWLAALFCAPASLLWHVAHLRVMLSGFLLCGADVTTTSRAAAAHSFFGVFWEWVLPLVCQQQVRCAQVNKWVLLHKGFSAVCLCVNCIHRYSAHAYVYVDCCCWQQLAAS